MSSDDVPELRGAQARIREAFFAHDSGLFVLDCNPGAGKSTVADQIAAEALVRASEAGDRSPEQGLCVTSFARDDAAAIEPGVEAALRAFADRDDIDIDAEGANDLSRRLRRADHLGTIDGVLRSVFADVATEVGFDGMPTVGNDALLSALRADCIDALRADPAHAEAFARLDSAYPGGEYADGVDDLLADALDAARERRLSVDEFGDRLRATVADAYPDGPPESFADVLADVERFVGEDAAAETDAAFTDGDRERFLAADRECHAAWLRAVEAFCELLAAYERAYTERSLDRGVASHLDAAHWVAEYFASDAHESAYRRRLRARYAATFSTVVVDEAQDVSVVQHDALAQLVGPDARVLLVGDVKQCIYAWRNARPSLFERAYDEGQYFGVDWPVHETERAARSYRMDPDIAAAVDAVFADAFADPTRGAAGSLDVDYPRLDPAREPTDEPSVHVVPHKYGFPASSDAPGWADGLASYLVRALEHGTLAGASAGDDGDADGDDDRPGVTVLFHRRKHMDALARKLEARGVSVANASARLFADPLVRLVAAVAEWLVDPTDPERTRALVTSDDCPLDAEPFAAADWSVRDVSTADRPEGAATVAAGLAALAGRRARHESDPGAVVVEEIVDSLRLAADPLDQTDNPGQRLANLDALVDCVAEREGDDRYTLAELADLLGRYRETPEDGPDQTAANPDDSDVVFKTIYAMKGDEDDVVVLADIRQHLGVNGPQGDAFVARGDRLALAPPAESARPKSGAGTPAVSGFDHGVYATDTDSDDGDAGLRWATERWPGEEATRLAGAPSLRAAAGDARAERWRLLYVAATRARDHLVVPLPRTLGQTNARDFWADALREGLDFDDAPKRGRYEAAAQSGDGGDRTFTVGVNDAPLADRLSSDGATPTPFAATDSDPDRARTSWTPRYVNASTLHPLVTDTDDQLLAHLKGRALHSDSESPDASLPLTFETMGPDVVGQVAHGVLTTAVSRRVSTADLRTCGGPVEAALDRHLGEHARDVNEDERRRLRAFVADCVCPQFAATETWDRLRASERVYVEESLDAVVRVGGLDVETYNHADVVSVDADGDWRVDDFKVALTDPDPTRSRRYDLQAATYAWLLERQLSDESVTATVTRLGVGSAARTADPPVMAVGAWFDRIPEIR